MQLKKREDLQARAKIVGHSIIFKALDSTNKVMSRSNLRPANDNNASIRAEPLTSSEVAKSLH